MSRPQHTSLKSKYVPYLKVETPPAARPHLPHGPDDHLTVRRVNAFKKAAKSNPELRLSVLATLRAHSVNGAETPLAGVAVLFSAFAVLASVATQVVSAWAWPVWVATACILVGLSLHIVRISLAAHTRRVVASVWLAAYTDR